MDKDQLEAAIERGLNAQHFLQFIDREPYFKMLFQEIDSSLINAMLGLDPNNKDAFTVLQSKRLALYEPINYVHRDIEVGKRAAEELEGTQEQKGIL